MNAEEVWAVVVTYNSAGRIRRCLDSVRASSVVPKIVVVDNDSQDGTIDIVTREYPEVTVLRSGGNLGFGQACNLGMKHALDHGAAFILQLNDDVRLQPASLAHMLNVAVTHPQFGILIPLQITEEGSAVDANFAAELKKYGSPELLADCLLGQAQDVYPIPVLPGAALLVRGAVVERLGGFDPLFFVYGVEYDYCLRTVILDWKVGFVPRAKVHHDRAVQSGESPLAVRKYMEDFYSTSLFILKRLDHSFLYMLLYEAAYYVYNVFLSLQSRNIRRGLAILITAPKLLKALPKVWLHRRWCLTREGVFLSDIEIPEPE